MGLRRPINGAVMVVNPRAIDSMSADVVPAQHQEIEVEEGSRDVPLPWNGELWFTIQCLVEHRCSNMEYHRYRTLDSGESSETEN